MSAARDSILETAGSLFYERGYERVGINEIIAKSEVAKATFYAHFPSKEKLCAEWLRTAAAESSAGNRELLGAAAPPEKKVARRFDALKKHLRSCEFRGCPFSITASMLDAGTEVREVIAEYKAGARAFWTELAREMRGDARSAKALGDALFLLYSGAVTESQNAGSDWPVDSAKRAALQLCGATVTA